MRVLYVLCLLLARIAPTEQVKVSHISEPGDSPPAPKINPKRDVTKSSVEGHQATQQSSTWKKLVAVDRLSRATNGWLDYFVVTYWGCVLAACAMIAVLREDNPELRLLFSEKTSDPAVVSAAKGPRSSWEGGPITRTLHANFWSLCLLCAWGQLHDGRGRMARPLPLYLIACFMGIMQICALAFVLIGINPDAKPWTTTPSASWVESGTSVNCMKFIMVLFQGLSVTTEASGAYENFFSAISFKAGETGPRPTIFAAIIPCFHYLITLGTILCGVSVVLSCQQAPAILYNSLAILFITQFDEVMFRFCKEISECQVDFEIAVTAREKTLLSRQILVGFPLLLGFALLGRAWYTNTMPVTTLVSMQIINRILHL